MNRLRQIFYGRNGIDALNAALLLAALIINLLSFIFRLIPVIRAVAVPVCFGVQVLFIAAAVFRAFSRNISTRQVENMKFMSITANVRRRLGDWKLQHGNNSHRFFKCPSCKMRLRVPKGKGKVFITCPQCGERFKKTT